MKLYEHQIKALEKTKGLSKVAYYLDMGLGKTFIGSEKLKEFDTSHKLVICQLSKLNDWVEHFKNHYNYNIYNLRSQKEINSFISGGGVGVINYELCWRRKELLKLKNISIMLDESSEIQNKSTNKTKFIMKFKDKPTILLSGTPTGGKYEKLWTQSRMLGWDITETMFKKEFIIYEYHDIGVRYIPIVKGYKNVDRLKHKLREHGAIFQKTEDVFDLPGQNHIDIKVDSTKEYKQFRRDRIIEINGIDLIGDTTLTQQLYEKQLASVYNKNKIKALEDLVKSTDDRLIIFYNYKKELELLKRLMRELDRPISEINGSCKNLDNYNKHDDSVTLVQYQAGSKGINLQLANKIIYFSLTDSSENFEQSKKRTHRIGQNKPCFYYYLLTKGSIDVAIKKALELKRDYTDELFKEGKYYDE